MQKPRRRVLETIYTPTPNSITIKNERVVAEATLFLPGPLPCAEKEGWVGLKVMANRTAGPLWEDERRRGRSCQRTNGEKHSTGRISGGLFWAGHTGIANQLLDGQTHAVHILETALVVS